MSKLTWFRQKRVDGGIRTAIDVNDAIPFHSFEKGRQTDDPVLLWWVDVRCKGARLPTDSEQVRHWFLEQSELIRGALLDLADELRAGIDVHALPVLREVVEAPPGVKMVVACSATGRFQRIQLAKVLTDIAKYWEHRLEQLPAVDPAEVE